MTWTGGRREGWVPRKPGKQRAADPPPAMAAVPVQLGPVAIPAFPCFSPAAVAQLLGVYRSTVQYWITAGKLECYRDNIGEAYVIRTELIRFTREYLRRPIANMEGQSPG